MKQPWLMHQWPIKGFVLRTNQLHIHVPNLAFFYRITRTIFFISIQYIIFSLRFSTLHYVRILSSFLDESIFCLPSIGFPIFTTEHIFSTLLSFFFVGLFFAECPYFWVHCGFLSSFFSSLIVELSDKSIVSLWNSGARGLGAGSLFWLVFPQFPLLAENIWKNTAEKKNQKKKRTTRVRNAPPRVYYFYSPSLPSLKKIPPFYEKKNTLSDTPPEQARPVFALFLVIDVVFFVWY